MFGHQPSIAKSFYEMDSFVLKKIFIFSLFSSISVDKLEPETQEMIRKKTDMTKVYFNKGL